MTDDPLEELERRYRELAGHVAELGFVREGTLLQRFTTCGRQGCHCLADPPRPHGPYWQWSRKSGGRTQSRRLGDDEAARYREWIGNDRRLSALVAEMHEVSRTATELILRRLRGTPAD